MAKMIQIRNVPDDVHKELKVRAAQMGMSLSDYLNRELVHIAETPTVDEMLERIKSLPPVGELSEPIEDAVRSERENR